MTSAAMNLSPDCKTPRWNSRSWFTSPMAGRPQASSLNCCAYPLCVAMTATHPFARLKSITLEKLAAEPLVGLRRKDYSEYYRIVDRVFASVHAKPRIAVECDSASSLITEVEAGRGVALSSTIFKLVAGKRLPKATVAEADASGVQLLCGRRLMCVSIHEESTG